MTDSVHIVARKKIKCNFSSKCKSLLWLGNVFPFLLQTQVPALFFRRVDVLHSWLLTFSFGPVLVCHTYFSMDKIISCFLSFFFSPSLRVNEIMLNFFRRSRSVTLAVTEHVKCFVEWWFNPCSKNIFFCLALTEGETFGVDWWDCARLCQHLSSSLSIRETSRCPAALLSFYFCHSHEASAVLHCQCVGELLLHV